MSNTPRDRMVDSAIKLLASHGFQGASFSAVLADSHAPRGSIYHHFPDGKDQLVAAAVELAGERAVGLVESLRGLPPAQIVSGFVGLWRHLLTASQFQIGCSLAGVTVTAEDPAVIANAATVFRAWQEKLADVLASGGVPTARTDDLSTTVIAACEGAVMLCRAELSLGPLERTERMLLDLVRQ